MRPTADPTFESIPPALFEAVDPFFEADALSPEDPDEAVFEAGRFELAVVFGLEFSRAFEADPACFAPPAAVRLPAPPLLVAVDVFDPPRFDEVVALATVFFDADFFDFVSAVEAPVLEELEDFAFVLFLELPVFAVEDLELFSDLLDAPFPEAVVFPAERFAALEGVFLLVVFGIPVSYRCKLLNSFRCIADLKFTPTQ